jgi:uncharacterized protein
MTCETRVRPTRHPGVKLMRASLITLLALGVLQPVVAQQSTTPSDESLRQLFEATHITRVLDSFLPTIDTSMQADIRQALNGQAPNAKQQQIIDDMRTQTVKLLRDNLSWEKLEPIYLDIYRRNFTQQEVDDMLVFYRSPTGRSVVDKMPATTDEASHAVQKRLPPIIDQIKIIEHDTAEKLKGAAQG